MTRARTVACGSLAVLAGAGAVAFGGQAPGADDLRAQLARERAQWKAQRAVLSRRARAKAPSYRTAMELAHVVYGVPVRGLSALTWCESRHTPGARNPTALSGSNATGAAQILYHPSGRRSSTWHSTSFAHLSPYDLTTNLLAAGEIWRRAGGSFREWADVCARQGDRA